MWSLRVVVISWCLTLLLLASASAADRTFRLYWTDTVENNAPGVVDMYLLEWFVEDVNGEVQRGHVIAPPDVRTTTATIFGLVPAEMVRFEIAACGPTGICSDRTTWGAYIEVPNPEGLAPSPVIFFGGQLEL